MSGSAGLYRLPAYRLVEQHAHGRRVLDVGCGDATGAARLAAAGAGDVLAIEADAALIKEASRLHRLANLRFASWTPPVLPAGDGTVDLLVCAMALADLEAADAAKLLDEVRRCVAPGGLAVIGVGSPARRPLLLSPRPPRMGCEGVATDLGARFASVQTFAVSPSHSLQVAPLAAEGTAPTAPTPTSEEPFLFLVVASDQPPSLAERLSVDLPYYLLADEIRTHDRDRQQQLETLRLQAETARTETLRMAGRAARAARLEERIADLELENRQLDEARRRAEELAADSEQRRVEAAAVHHELDDAKRRVGDLEQRVETADSAMVELAAERDRAERERDSLARAQQELLAEFEALKTAEGDRQTGADERRAELGAARAEAQEAKAQLARQTGELHAQRERAAQLQQAHDSMREELLTAHEQESSLRAERDRLASRLQSAEEELSSFRENTARQTQRLDEAAAKARRQQQILEDLSETRQALEQEKRARESLETTSSDQKARLEVMTQDLETARTEARRRAEEVGTLRADRDGLSEEVQAQRAEGERRQAEINQLHEQVTELDAELDAQRIQADHLRAQLDAEVAVVAERTAELREREGALQQLELHGMGEHARARIEELENDLAAARAELGQLGERSRILAEVAAERDRLREEATRRGGELVALSERLAEARSALGHRDTALARVQAECDTLREQIEMRRAAEAALADELERSRKGSASVQDERARATADVAQLRAALEEAQSLAQARGVQVAQAQAEAARTMRDSVAQAEELGRLRGELEAAHSEMEAARRSLDGALNDLARARGDSVNEREERERIQAELDAISSELTMARAELHGREEQQSSEALEQMRGEVDRLTRLLVGQRSRLGRELEVRAQEMEEALMQIELRDGEIWTLRDEALRNAARLAAAMADIERLRERIAEMEQPADELIGEPPPQA